MKRNILSKMIFPYLMGILFCLSSFNYLIGATIVALFLIYLSLNKEAQLFLLFIILGMAVGYTSIYRYQQTYNKLSSLNKFKGTIISLSIDKKNCYIKNNGYLIKAYFKKPINAEVSDKIEIEGKIKPQNKYVFSKGYNADIEAQSYFKYDKENIIFTLLYKLRDNIKRKTYKIDSFSAPFVNGLILGDIDGIEDYIKQILINLNISHIVVVSGAHLGIIIIATMIIFSFNFKIRYISLISITTLYTALSGFTPSLTRAYIMFLLATVALFLKRHSDAINLLLVCVFIMTATNAYIIYNFGFILSILSVLGILILNPKISRRINGTISIPLSSYIFTLPVVLYINGSTSLISILVNVLITPIVGFLTIFAFFSLVLYLICQLNFIFYPVLFLSRIFLNLLCIIDKFNIEIVLGRWNIIYIFVYYSLIALILDLFFKVSYKIKRVVVISVVSILIIFNLLIPRDLVISFIDVGQGDSIFIETPNKRTILIDTGGKFKDYNMAKERVIPYIKRRGYSKIDLFIITHFHNDHAGGVDYIIDNFKVGRLIAYKSNDKRFQGISDKDEIIVDNLYMRVITDEDLSLSDENEKCIVIQGKYKEFDFLLTADAGLELMKKIKGEFEVVKMPHHGSKYSFNEEIMKSIKFKRAVISVGKNNFGHPSHEVIDLLDKNYIKYNRTDRDGTIQVKTNGKSFWINAER